MKEIAKHILHVNAHLFDAHRSRKFNRGKTLFAHFDFDQTIVEFARTKLRAQLLPRARKVFVSRLVFRHQHRRRCLTRIEIEKGTGSGRFWRRQQNIQNPFFDVEFGLVRDLFNLFLSHHVNGNLGEVANHALHIAADVTHFSKLGGFNFQERRIRHPRQTTGNLSLADTGRANHDDVLRDYIGGEIGWQLLSSHAVAQGDGHRALRCFLPNDVLVEFDNDLPRRHLVETHFLLFSFTREIDNHCLNQMNHR